jgi:ADP-ribose pyrophosphatase YjhB (NUDIX family)
MHIVAVCGLFTNAAGEVLVVKTPRRGWECPGGLVELGEELIEAHIREVREESGCEIEIERLVGVYPNVGPPEKVIFMFRGRHRTGTPCPSEETLEAGWFTVAPAQEPVTNAPDAFRLQDALAGGDRPVYRVYTTHPYAAMTRLTL